MKCNQNGPIRIFYQCSFDNSRCSLDKIGSRFPCKAALLHIEPTLQPDQTKVRINCSEHNAPSIKPKLSCLFGSAVVNSSRSVHMEHRKFPGISTSTDCKRGLWTSAARSNKQFTKQFMYPATSLLSDDFILDTDLWPLLRLRNSVCSDSLLFECPFERPAQRRNPPAPNQYCDLAPGGRRFGHRLLQLHI